MSFFVQGKSLMTRRNFQLPLGIIVAAVVATGAAGAALARPLSDPTPLGWIFADDAAPQAPPQARAKAGRPQRAPASPANAWDGIDDWTGVSDCEYPCGAIR